MGTYNCTMKLLLSLAVVVATVSAAPRYLVIPVEDVDFSNFAGRTLPVVRMPGLMRHTRQVEEDEDDYRSGPFAPRDSQGAGSAPYGAPPATGPDHVDYGAYTGGYGAFGWYTDHPVLLAAGH